MVTFFIVLIVFSFTVSSFTLGLRIITDKGMILYPLRKWVLSVRSEKKKQINTSIQQWKEQKSQAALNTDKELFEAASENIEKLEMKLFWIDAWHKPLLTCSSCMASVWGIVFTFVLLGYAGPIIFVVAPVGMMLSVVINTFVFRFY